MNDLTYVIATRKGSKRIKNKNTRKFGKTNLLEIKLKQIKRIDKNPKIFFSSNCNIARRIAAKYDVEIDKRPNKYASDTVPMRDVYAYLARKVNTKYVCYLHVTAPFLKDTTLKKAIRIFFKSRKFDSLASVTQIKEYLWFKNKPINYNPKNHPSSQNLPEYLALNFAVNIVSTKYMKSKGRIVGEKFFPLILKQPESFDLDYQWQFDIADTIIKKMKKN
tara:strand:+ start:631 stop:1290 length:660 start_codon:yes stop_codon:yes gene_type:complete